MIVWLILFAILVMVAMTEYSAYRTGVPTVASFSPSRKVIIEQMTKFYAENTKQPFTILDLGSGNGQLATRLARALPNTDITGIEISIIPFAISYVKNFLFGPKNLKFKRVSFWNYDISKADAIVIFLTGKVMDRMSEKLRKELKPGTFILSNELTLRGDWQPTEVLDTGFLTMRVYAYRQTQ